MPLDPLKVSTPVLAALCGVTPRRIQQLADGGVLRSEARGSWDALVCVPAYLAHRIAQAEAAAAKARGSAADRHVNAKARAVEMRTAREEGVLMETAEALALLEEVIGTAKAEFDGLPARATRDLTMRGKIENETAAIWDRLGAKFRHRAAELRHGSEAAPADASPAVPPSDT